MTHRDRISAALQHREPDRTPIFEYVLLSPLANVVLGRRYAGDSAHWKKFEQEKGWEGAVRRSASVHFHKTDLHFYATAVRRSAQTWSRPSFAVVTRWRK